MRLIEGLATVRYDSDQDVVEVNFFGKGDIIDYQVAIQVALDVAAAYQTNRWKLIKRDFTDINTGRFLSYVSQWMRPPPKSPAIHEISIMTKIQAYRKMKGLLKYNKLYNPDRQVTENLKIDIICTEAATETSTTNI